MVNLFKSFDLIFCVCVFGRSEHSKCRKLNGATINRILNYMLGCLDKMNEFVIYECVFASLLLRSSAVFGSAFVCCCLVSSVPSAIRSLDVTYYMHIHYAIETPKTGPNITVRQNN